MKKQSLRIFLMFGLFSILAVSSIQAQSNATLRADIPFSFTVGNKTFPAGGYRVERLNPSSPQAILALKSVDGRTSVILLTRDVEGARAQEKAKLVFNQYGDQYHLFQIWRPSDNIGLEIPKSRSERMLARDAGERAPVRTAIALSSRPR